MKDYYKPILYYVYCCIRQVVIYDKFIINWRILILKCFKVSMSRQYKNQENCIWKLSLIYPTIGEVFPNEPSALYSMRLNDQSLVILRVMLSIWKIIYSLYVMSFSSYALSLSTTICDTKKSIINERIKVNKLDWFAICDFFCLKNKQILIHWSLLPEVNNFHCLKRIGLRVANT